MPRDTRVLLEDMLDALNRIKTYTNDFQAVMLEDPRTLDAVIRNLEVLGEAAKGVPDEVRTTFPQIEWRKISGFRDVLAHQYFGVDISVVTDVVTQKIPVIRQALVHYLAVK